ncbi:hypothetical protein LWI29_019301 [Acer saccharum]|uniref:Uncharacterized protein n=1 Tax=Acer saccharum TaxID=4024 RepID=A0AA39VVQ2_ACESA|nr:hypothetical protein LWI29_019301 [Acer saccharum]
MVPRVPGYHGIGGLGYRVEGPIAVEAAVLKFKNDCHDVFCLTYDLKASLQVASTTREKQLRQRRGIDELERMVAVGGGIGWRRGGGVNG